MAEAPRRGRTSRPATLLACVALSLALQPGRCAAGPPEARAAHPAATDVQRGGAGHERRAAREALQRAIDDFEAVDLSGRQVSARGLRGRVVILDFWATWCAPCLAELPRLRRAQAHYGDRLAIVGISLDVVSRAELTGWLRRHEVPWPQVFDGRGWSSPVVRAFGVEAIPYSLLVDASGRLVGVNVTGPRLDRALEALLPAP